MSGLDTLRQAVALGYEHGMPAPRVLAQGRGAVAEAILQKAREMGIPTQTDPGLVEFLMQLDLNAWVPPELYAAVAEVLAWAHHSQQQGSPATPPPASGA
jgi:flagellar biosynthesis protein